MQALVFGVSRGDISTAEIGLIPKYTSDLVLQYHNLPGCRGYSQTLN